MKTVTFISFGHKFAPPPAADYLFDARCIDNPYWCDELRPYNGLEQPIADYFRDNAGCQRQLRLILQLLRHSLELSQHKSTPIVVAIGCTGGRHRSVYLCQQLTLTLQAPGLNCQCQHRDIHHDSHQS